MVWLKFKYLSSVGTFANCLDPDQDRQNIGSAPERICFCHASSYDIECQFLSVHRCCQQFTLKVLFRAGTINRNIG